MASKRARGLSLWLLPRGESFQRLESWIHRLATRFGTETFPPHLTLISALELDEQQSLVALDRMVVEIPALTISLGAVEGREEHFRCLFLGVKDDHALHDAHAAAARVFGREPEVDFLPHLSLVYGTLAPEAKLAVAHEIGAALRLQLECEQLQLWRTEGPVAAWNGLATRDLRPRSRLP